MATTKKGVEYFPHFTNAATESGTVLILEKHFQNDGYAVWYKLLECLGRQEGLCINRNNKTAWAKFVDICLIPEEKIVEIIDTLSEVDAIDKVLWRESGIIWSDNFAENVANVYKRRVVDTPTKPVISAQQVESDTPHAFNSEKFDCFCKTFNVQVDGYNATFYEIDFDKLTICFNESSYLRTVGWARTISGICKNYSSIIAGKYKDLQREELRRSKMQGESQKTHDMFEELYLEYSEEENNGGNDN